jgi:hypothetical protein
MGITGSVGAGGINARKEAQYVQALLNVFRAEHGGVPLTLDGIVGPKTISAISEFQTAVTGAVDGRVDPGGPAITALEAQIADFLGELRAVTMLSLPLSYEPRQEEPPPDEEPTLDDGKLTDLVQSLFDDM